MAALFAQSIAQFAPLRTFARIDYAHTQPAQLIRELFPKALFDEKNVSFAIFFEIAWSFLSAPELDGGGLILLMHLWRINRTEKHRIGGLPAVICTNSELITWHKNGKFHRDDKDPKTGLTLPALMDFEGLEWFKKGKRHRDDKDPRTGLTLPAIVPYHYGKMVWCKNGKCRRRDKDPNTGLTLPKRSEYSFF